MGRPKKQVDIVTDARIPPGKALIVGDHDLVSIAEAAALVACDFRASRITFSSAILTPHGFVNGISVGSNKGEGFPAHKCDWITVDGDWVTVKFSNGETTMSPLSNVTQVWMEQT